MIPSFPNKLPQSPIYKKAQDIFTLSRHISNYMTDDLAVLQEDGNEDPYIYFGGDIVQQSVSLVPEILKAESQTYAEEKHKYAASVTKLINRLYKNCERLELTSSNGKDFLPILRGEIKKFRKLQRHWMLTL
ncbi:MAG: hypothetical protein KJO05_03625 [Bacteroidia bacterium]|nr:hypothetical protein [Bacteroidia bacterium]NNF30320.1 hypothetical protein [Flavobacteriaceae bacterium]MBT8276396.1 hypothetical protein [Bacteroidia bacterium]NNJ81759.1 hypothetical protein [Flavobacteriaceae bacterium]NNK53535.1 hypothetical protein [Flavobacteriaceae bacterium]